MYRNRLVSTLVTGGRPSKVFGLLLEGSRELLANETEVFNDFLHLFSIKKKIKSEQMVSTINTSRKGIRSQPRRSRVLHVFKGLMILI